MTGYWLIRCQIMMGKLNDEAIEAHLCRNALLQVALSGEELYYCMGCYDAGKLMNVSESMVRNAMNKGNNKIVRRTGGVKVLHLEWLPKSECKCENKGYSERTSCRC